MVCPIKILGLVAANVVSWIVYGKIFTVCVYIAFVVSFCHTANCMFPVVVIFVLSTCSSVSVRYSLSSYYSG